MKIFLKIIFVIVFSYFLVSSLLWTDNSWFTIDINQIETTWSDFTLFNFYAERIWGDSPFQYVWDFWDGNKNIWKYVQHVYWEEGDYEVHLTVTDNNWDIHQWTRDIIVLDNDACLQDDCDDLCPILVWSEDNHGCPIFEIWCEDSSCPDWYVCSEDSICRPPSIAQSCLFDPSVGAIFWNTFCTECPCNIELDFRAQIRKCDIVFPAITSPNMENIYSQWDGVIVPKQ